VIHMLRCYECATSDANEEAVSICIMCGKGLCMEHAKRIDLLYGKEVILHLLKCSKKVFQDLYAVTVEMSLFPEAVNKKDVRGQVPW